MARTVLTKGLVFDGTGAPPVPGEVTLAADRVLSVTPGYRDDHGTDRVIDVTGCTVMPGLIESHGHLTFPSAVGQGDSHDDRDDGEVGKADAESDGQLIKADADPEGDQRQTAAAGEAAGFSSSSLSPASSIQAPMAITAAPAR